MDRRFQPVNVQEPSLRDAEHILRSISKYEEHHGVRLERGVVEEIVDSQLVIFPSDNFRIKQSMLDPRVPEYRGKKRERRRHGCGGSGRSANGHSR